MGYWVDMSDPYITYDNRYIETLWYCSKNYTTKDTSTRDIPYSHTRPRRDGT